MNSVALRIQGLPRKDQALLLSRVAQARAGETRFAPRDVESLYADLALPAPTRVWDVLSRLESEKLLTRSRGHGSVWAVTPLGRQRASELISDEDLTAVLAESAATGLSMLGNLAHPLLPPLLAPPESVPAIRAFLADYPFETNVFGMTRFPDEGEESEPLDPLEPTLTAAREACALHGLTLHFASDGALADDLWTNVSAYMWACRFGIAFFEDRKGKGVNYNMSIEVGSMLMAGRRCALLKDRSVEKMPTDLVGRIYKSVDLDDEGSVSRALHGWLRDDLRLGSCVNCVS